MKEISEAVIVSIIQLIYEHVDPEKKQVGVTSFFYIKNSQERVGNIKICLIYSVKFSISCHKLFDVWFWLFVDTWMFDIIVFRIRHPGI